MTSDRTELELTPELPDELTPAAWWWLAVARQVERDPSAARYVWASAPAQVAYGYPRNATGAIKVARTMAARCNWLAGLDLDA